MDKSSPKKPGVLAVGLITRNGQVCLSTWPFLAMQNAEKSVQMMWNLWEGFNSVASPRYCEKLHYDVILVVTCLEAKETFGCLFT